MSHTPSAKPDALAADALVPRPDEPAGSSSTRDATPIDGSAWPVIDRLVDRVPALIFVVWGAILGATPWLGDDRINKQARVNSPTLAALWADISAQTTAWMRLQGRFFPSSVAWTRILLWSIPSRAGYKLVLGVLLIGAVIVVGLLAQRITRGSRLATLVTIALAAVIQLRLLADPFASYTGLIPMTMGLSAGAALIAMSARRWWWGVLAGLGYAVAVTMYETVILFAPILVAIVWFERRRWRWTLPIIIPAALQAAIVLFLRGRLTTAPAPAYTVNLAPAAVLSALERQMAAALPMSQWILNAPGTPRLEWSNVVLACVVVGAPAAVLVHRTLHHRLPTVSWSRITLLGGLGAWVWVSSSLLVAITVRWQQELAPGEGYLPVGYAYFGLALFGVAAVLAVSQVLAARSPVARRAFVVLTAAAVGALVSTTLAGNLAIVAAYPPAF